LALPTERYGLNVFQRFFEQVIELCLNVRLVWGKELYFDGSKIRANAAIDGLVDRATWNVVGCGKSIVPKTLRWCGMSRPSLEARAHGQSWHQSQASQSRLGPGVPTQSPFGL